MQVLSQRPASVALMGVCNVTPDSFSDGGRFATFEAACARVDTLFAEGAHILDIGGESTRPGAPRVPAAKQLERVLQVVTYAAGLGACVSIDTQDPEVARACLEAGASAVNDVSCLRSPALAEVCASLGAALVLMHARGDQAEMSGFGAVPEASYGDVVADVVREWSAAASQAVSLGVSPEALVMDPGLGFAKAARHSFELLRRTRELVDAVKVPVLVGASRKSFLTLAGASKDPTARLAPSLAAALHAKREGARAVRVHDVAETRDAFAVADRLDCALPENGLLQSASPSEARRHGEPFRGIEAAGGR